MKAVVPVVIQGMEVQPVTRILKTQQLHIVKVSGGEVRVEGVGEGVEGVKEEDEGVEEEGEEAQTLVSTDSTKKAQTLVRLGELLTCERYEVIGNFLHLVTPAEVALSGNKLSKILPLHNYIK